MIEALLIVLIVILVLGIGFLYFSIRSKSNGPQVESMQLLQNQINLITRQQDEKFDRMQEMLLQQQKSLNEQMDKSNISLQRQFAVSQKSLGDYTEKIKDLAKEVAKMSETGKNIQGFAEQLQSLENILKNPKQRGVLGEYFLETVLKSVLPPESYEMQYHFPDGNIVDALVKTREGTIPVDAKFSLENYNRAINSDSPADREKHDKAFRSDLKARIDETAKYIRPEDGTLDFAFMFIPADGLYYELLVNRVGTVNVSSEHLLDYAFGKRVIIVSPTTFFAYLQTVYHGLRALKIEQSATQILKDVGILQKHLKNYEDNFRKLGSHIGNTVTSYNSASKELTKIDKDLIKVTGDSMLSISVDQYEKPIDHVLD